MSNTCEVCAGHRHKHLREAHFGQMGRCALFPFIPSPPPWGRGTAQAVVGGLPYPSFRCYTWKEVSPKVDVDSRQPDLFAIFTKTGDEQHLKQLILALQSDIRDTDIFIPQKVVYKRGGRNRRLKYVTELFHGYIFLRTSDPEALFFSLKHIPKLTSLLHDGDFDFVPLQETERNFLELICSLSIRAIKREAHEPEKLVLPVSTVKVISKMDAGAGDVLIPRDNPAEALQVKSGPLLQLAPYVTKIDYSHRKAILDVSMFGEHNLHIGIRMERDDVMEG